MIHIAYDPSSIDGCNLGEITKAYEDVTLPRELRAMISSLLIIGAKVKESMNASTHNREDTGLNNGRFGEISEDEENDVEDFSKILVASTRVEEIVDYCLQATLCLAGILAPATRKEAMSSPQKDIWFDAKQKEIESINSKKYYSQQNYLKERSY